MRARAQHTAGYLLSDQLCAYCAVCLVLSNDERTISYVSLVGVRLGGLGKRYHGDTGGIGGGHIGQRLLSLARFDSRRCGDCAWGRHCLSLEQNTQKAAV